MVYTYFFIVFGYHENNLQLLKTLILCIKMLWCCQTPCLLALSFSLVFLSLSTLTVSLPFLTCRVMNCVDAGWDVFL